MQSSFRPSNLNDFYPTVDKLDLTDESIDVISKNSFIILGGEKGCGKTTFARILARKVVSHPSNVLEINAKAEEGKAENLRQLLSGSSLDTGIFDEGKNVIIIDEAHLLSKAAESLFLKPVEDNMENLMVIFITNEYSSIRHDLRDRAFHIDFKPISNKNDLYKFVKKYSEMDDFNLGLSDKEIKMISDKMTSTLTPRHILGVLQYCKDSDIKDVSEVLNLLNMAIDGQEEDEIAFKDVLNLAMSQDINSMLSTINRIVSSANASEVIEAMKRILSYLIKNNYKFKLYGEKYLFTIRLYKNLTNSVVIFPEMTIHVAISDAYYDVYYMKPKDSSTVSASRYSYGSKGNEEAVI